MLHFKSYMCLFVSVLRGRTSFWKVQLALNAICHDHSLPTTTASAFSSSLAYTSVLYIFHVILIHSHSHCICVCVFFVVCMYERNRPRVHACEQRRVFFSRVGVLLTIAIFFFQRRFRFALFFRVGLIIPYATH